MRISFSDLEVTQVNQQLTAKARRPPSFFQETLRSLRLCGEKAFEVPNSSG